MMHLLFFLEIREDISPGQGTAGNPGTADKMMKTRRTIHREDDHGQITPDGLLDGEPRTCRTTGDESDHAGRGPDNGAISDEKRGNHLPAGGTLRRGTFHDLTAQSGEPGEPGQARRRGQ